MKPTFLLLVSKFFRIESGPRQASRRDKDFVYEDDEQYNKEDPNAAIAIADESMIRERNELEFEVLNIKRNVVLLQKQKLQLEVKKLSLELSRMESDMRTPIVDTQKSQLRGVRRPKTKTVPLPAINTAFSTAQLQGSSVQIISHADLGQSVTELDFSNLPTVTAPMAIPVNYEPSVPSEEHQDVTSTIPFTYATPSVSNTAAGEAMPSMPSLSPWHDYSQAAGAPISL